jgi:hypothetical protein
MKAIFSLRRGHIPSNLSTPASTGEPRPRLSLTVADRVAFVLFAAGLVALGGVLLAAGLAILLALTAGGVVIGAIAVARRRLLGGRATTLAPGEIPPTAAVLPSSAAPTAIRAPSPSSAPRAD